MTGMGLTQTAEQRLDEADDYCDCRELLNSKGRISSDELLPTCDVGQ